MTLTSSFSLYRTASLVAIVLLIGTVVVDAGADPIPIRVDVFARDLRAPNLEVEGQSVPEMLAREMNRSLAADTVFSVSRQAPLTVGGRVTEFTFRVERTNAAGQALQKTVKISVDLQVMDQRSAREVAAEKNLIEEFLYYTEAHNISSGLTDRAAVEEHLVVALADRIRRTLLDHRSTLESALVPIQAIELSEEERDALDRIGARPPEAVQRERIFSGSVSLENQTIRIPSGTLQAAGVQEQVTNRFLATGTLNMNKTLSEVSRLEGSVTGRINSDVVPPVYPSYLERYVMDYYINEANTLRAGTVNPSLSSYVFDRTIEGVHYTHEMKSGQVSHAFDAFGGREFNADGTGIRPRGSYGASWNVGFGRVGNVKLLGSLTRDYATIVEAGNVTQNVDNGIYGATGRFRAPFGTVLDFSALQSSHRNNFRNDTQTLEGALYQVRARQNVRALELTGEYYLADADYRTVLGSATTDKEKVAATARLPLTWRVFDLVLNSSMTRSNRVRNNDRTDALYIGGGDLGISPFKGGTNPVLKDLFFSLMGEYRRNYDEMVLTGALQGKDLSVLTYMASVKNTFYDIFTTGVRVGEIRERNKLQNSLFDVGEIAWENRLAIADYQGVGFDLSFNHRWKDSNGRTDRFTTVGARVRQTIDAFHWQFDYLHDLTRGLIRLQDTTKDRFTLDLNYAPTMKWARGSFGLNLDYEMDAFGDATKDYDRFTTTATARFAF